MPSKITKSYRKIFGHKSPYRRVYGSRNAGQAIGTTYRTLKTPAQDIAKLVKDVREIKKRQNVEKNYVDVDVITSDLGQVSNDNDGIRVLDVTPQISQGDGQGNRHGNSLKLTGMSFPMSFLGQARCHSARKIQVSLMRVRDNDNSTSGTDLVQQYWDVNPLNGMRDTNAPKNYRNSKHDGIACIRQKTYMLKATQHDVPGSEDEKSHFTAKFNVTLQDVLRYAEDGHSSPDGFRYFLVFQCDAGNHSTVASTLDVPVKIPDSGVALRVSQRAWYVDN